MNSLTSVYLIVGPVVAAVLTLTCLRWRRVTILLGVTFTLTLGLWLRFLELDGEKGRATLIFGRSLTLTEGVRSLFLFLTAGLALLLILSWVMPQGKYFVPASLSVLSPLAAMLMIRPFAFGVLFWFIAVAILTVVIQSDRAGQTQAALRYLVMFVLVAPLILVAAWMLETGQGGIQLTAGRLLVVAFIISLAGFPFHIWVRPIVSDVSMFSATIIFGLAQLALTLFIYNILAEYSWIQTDPDLLSLIRWSSAFSALTAGVLALAAADFSHLLGSLILLDMSVSLALLVVPVTVGWGTAVALPIIRFINLLLVAVGLKMIAAGPTGLKYSAGHGLARQSPLATLVIAFGFISLVGLPLTVGFSGRWAALALISAQPTAGQWLSPVILMAMGGGIYGVWRGLAPLLAAGNDARFVVSFRMRLILALGLIAILWLVMSPQSIMSYAHHLADFWINAG